MNFHQMNRMGCLSHKPIQWRVAEVSKQDRERRALMSARNRERQAMNQARMAAAKSAPPAAPPSPDPVLKQLIDSHDGPVTIIGKDGVILRGIPKN